jgi:hypothetical protein
LHALRTGVAPRGYSSTIVKWVLFACLVAVGAQMVPLQELHESGIAHHMERSLDAAAAAYDEVLRRDPPREPTSVEWTTVARFAPRVFVTRMEPFRLMDAAAIVHPSGDVIAYHLFWEDDIDYPDDNEPSDHEVVWCILSSDRTRLQAFRTYFHGRVLAGADEALRDAVLHGGRPAVMVQWGKHGSMPRGWERLSIAAEDGETESDYVKLDRPISLEEYNKGTWRKLTTAGRRARDNPIAARAGWPATFDGDWRAFAKFPTHIDPLPMIQQRRTALVSRWNAAALNRWLIRYNFRPKLEWPDDDDVLPGATKADFACARFSEGAACSGARPATGDRIAAGK